MISMDELLRYTNVLSVLYIEDDVGLLKENKELLSNFFNNVDIAKDGEEGFNKYKSGKYDIVISDLKMPKMGGIELSQKIKELNIDQEIIIISAYDDSDNLIKLIKIGVSDFMLKPMEFTQLLNILYKVSRNIYFKKQYELFLVEQSKLALIGEMMDMIAHQWIGILNVLGLKTEFLELENSTKELSQGEIQKYIDYYSKGIEELNLLLREFRDFFKTKPKQKVRIADLIEGVLLLMNDYIMKNKVTILKELDDTQACLYPNEFKQVIINLIHNSIEAFNETKKENRIIKIKLLNNFLSIEDNAKGIENDLKSKIFKANFTTKQKGSGKGLYLVKMILDKIDGKISFENTKDGVKFIIKVSNGC